MVTGFCRGSKGDLRFPLPLVGVCDTVGLGLMEMEVVVGVGRVGVNFLETEYEPDDPVTSLSSSPPPDTEPSRFWRLRANRSCLVSTGDAMGETGVSTDALLPWGCTLGERGATWRKMGLDRKKLGSGSVSWGEVFSTGV